MVLWIKNYNYYNQKSKYNQKFYGMIGWEAKIVDADGLLIPQSFDSCSATSVIKN